MELFVILAYCSADDAIKKNGLIDNVQTRVSAAQILTTIIVAARFYGANHKQAQDFLFEHRYFDHKLSRSQFCRRLHAIPDDVFTELQALFASYAKSLNESYEFAIDSFPVPACDNIRIQRSRLFDPKKCRGFIASKRRYFHGVRVHVIATHNRLVVDFVILDGATSDIQGAKKLAFDLPAESTVYADKAYSDYKYEDTLLQTKNIHLEPIRKKNLRRQRSEQEEKTIKSRRRPIETLFSVITRWMPKTIHAVTPKGFIKKLKCFLFAHSIESLMVTT